MEKKCVPSLDEQEQYKTVGEIANGCRPYFKSVKFSLFEEIEIVTWKGCIICVCENHTIKIRLTSNQ